ncbi:MAG: valine--tRNA ligase [Nitrospinota bacterium]|nr:valine--tRNA ligase [Nitrospinota bacterium]
MLETRYNPKVTEAKWYADWQKKEYFKGIPDSKKKMFSLVIPPPNVTGSLHMGHALNNTLQDILARWHRMKGFSVCWMPGTDHAGIATQNVVERMLSLENKSREELGRENFVKEIWKWKEKSGGTIINQLHRLGASCDWDKERFTMDEGLSIAVREAFVRLYEDDLIYRGDYLVNWCPRCGTAVSDLEVEFEEQQGSLWDIFYPFENEESGLIVSTTRPETMLGDTALAVHPQDERYKKFIGRKLQLPLVGREIPLIADDFVDPEFGSGVVKITPAHDPNDYEAGKRNELPQINILTEDGKINENGGKYQGLDRFEAREKIISDLKNLSFLKQVKDHEHNVGICYRCETIIEPFLSKQWFIRTKPLAEEAIRSVENGKIRIIPKQWENTYFEWMHNIKDWCISRQIWWGHQIPAWYNVETGEVIVSREDITDQNYRRETDVLDTWFSSALWPFSTFGWPKKTPDLDYFYPTSTLVTGFDIIFFWVARMIMAGLKFMDDVPFKDVYIHALVRDEDGQKMSKTRGNVIDPIEIIEESGADSLRFTLTAMAAQGRDVRLSEERIAGYRNFCNKIWNAARFILLNVEKEVETIPESSSLTLADRWILSRANSVTREVEKSLDEYRFNDFASTLYQFIWHEFCDWYIEAVKPNIINDEIDSKSKDILVLVLSQILRLLHPVMPFITEEIWDKLPIKGKKSSIMVSEWPKYDPEFENPDSEEDFSIIIDIVSTIRNLRGELNISPGQEIPCLIKVSNQEHESLILREEETIKRLSKIGSEWSIGTDIQPPKLISSAVIRNMQIFIPLEGLIDIDSETNRLKKQLAETEKTVLALKKKLSNKEFTQKAPKEVIEKNEEKLKDEQNRHEKLSTNLNKLTKTG